MNEEHQDRPLGSAPQARPPLPQREWVACRLPVRWIVRRAALGTPPGNLLTTLAPPARLAAVFAGTATFIAIYLWTIGHNALRRPATNPSRSDNRRRSSAVLS